MKKNLTLAFITIITIVQLYAIVYYYKMESFAFAWILNFMLMSMVFPFVIVLKSELHFSYFNEKNWEKGGKLYETFGIHFFRKLLVWIGWEKLTKREKPVAKNLKTLTYLHYRTKHDEFGHLIILLIVLGFNLFVAFKFGIIKSLWLLTLNIILNLYPIFLQRYNRPRIQRVLNLSQRKS